MADEDPPLAPTPEPAMSAAPPYGIPAASPASTKESFEALNALLQDIDVSQSVESMSQSVEAFGTAEQAQTLLQTTMVRDLMRCIADNHRCIQAQGDALNFSNREITSLRDGAPFAVVVKSSA